MLLPASCAKTSLTDSQLGDAFDPIFLVAKYLKEVLNVSHHMDLVYLAAEAANLGLTKEQIDLLKNIQELINQVNSNKDSIEKLENLLENFEKIEPISCADIDEVLNGE